MKRPGITILGALIAGALLILAAPASADPVVVVRPGDTVVAAAGEHDGDAKCTVGFVGTIPYIDAEGATVERERGRMAVSAGHCFRERAVVYLLRDGERIPIGNVIARQREPWVDSPDDEIKNQDMSGFTLIALAPSVGASALTTIGPIRGTDTDVRAGEELCHIGATTGFRCGPVTSVTTTRIDVSAVVDKGDSGGPVVRVKRTDDGRSELYIVGMQVAASWATGVLSVNPWRNLAANLDSAIGSGWKYYYSTAA